MVAKASSNGREETRKGRGRCGCEAASERAGQATGRALAMWSADLLRNRQCFRTHVLTLEEHAVRVIAEEVIAGVAAVAAARRAAFLLHEGVLGWARHGVRGVGTSGEMGSGNRGRRRGRSLAGRGQGERGVRLERRMITERKCTVLA